MKSFSEAISSVKLIPIRCGQGPMLGSRLELIHLSGDYILCDMENSIICRYDCEGNFLNTIGHKGNGPDEYVSLGSGNVQVVGDTIAAFTGFGDLLLYDKEGQPLGHSKTDKTGLQSLLINGGLLTYHGYTAGKGDRMIFTKDGFKQGFLPTEKERLPLLTSTPLLSQYGDDAFLIDSFSSTIYRFRDGELNPYLEFDFGKYRLPDSYLKVDDPYEGAEILMSSEFAYIIRYLHGDEYRLAEILTQKKGDYYITYGLCDNNGWRWFSEGEDREKRFFEDSPRLIEGKCLIALIAPEKLNNALEYFRGFPLDCDLLSLEESESLNCVIALINLK